MELGLIPRFLRDLRRVRARERWSRERILAFQAAELRRVRADAVARSPFYREHHRGLEGAPFTVLPPVSKLQMMERFDDVVTDRRIRKDDVWAHMRAAAETGDPYLGRYRIATSSGSSGEVTISLAGPAEHIYNLVAASRGRAFGGLPWNPLRPRKVAEVVGTLPWLGSAQFARTEKSRFAPLLHLGAGDRTDRIVAQLNDWQPEILEGYTSIIGVLADEQIAGRLRIAPKMIGTGGESISPEIRRRCRQAWNLDPFDYYGTCEGGTHAVECLEGRRMHLMDDMLIHEIVDEDNQPVPVGELGARVLITPLWRTTQPFIRYQITDAVRLSPDPCVCGRPFAVIDEIRGRVSRLLTIPRADGTGSIQLSGMAFNLVVALPVIWRRLVQEGDRIVIYVVGMPDGFDAAPIVAGLEAALLEHGAQPTPVEVRILPEIPRTAAGKAVVDPAAIGARAGDVSGS